MRRPFDGIRVLDLTHVLAGPFCGYQFALLGADVIKIEPPDNPDCVRYRGRDEALAKAGMGLTYQAQGANKRALALDLASGEGREIFLALLAGADVMIENYRVGALAAHGLGVDELRARFPRLIHCSMTGFGQLGEKGGINAYDNVIQAASGIMAGTGGASGPVKTAASVIDYAAGYNAAFAIAAALFQRERTGAGQAIDCAMFDVALTLQAPEASAALHEGPMVERPREAGLGTYATREGHLTLGAFNPRQNMRLWTALDRPDFAGLTDWPELWAHADAMRAALEKILLARTAAEWEAFLNAHGVPAARVRALDEAARMRHLGERGFFHQLPPSSPDVAGAIVPTAAFRYAAGGPRIDSSPPRLGEHTDSILAGLGRNEADIARLRREGIVA